MQHRWDDVHRSVAGCLPGDSAVFLGGTEKADLWLTEELGVLICQYEDSNDYVSYYPARAIYARIKGRKNGNDGTSAIIDYPPEARVWWTGSDESEDNHDPMGIARYLAVFAPDIFTEEERADLLGVALTLEENKE